MATAKQKRELDLSPFPQGSVTEYALCNVIFLLAPSGGKPAFPTLRLLSHYHDLGLKVSPARIGTQECVARGWEGRLALLGWLTFELGNEQAGMPVLQT